MNGNGLICGIEERRKKLFGNPDWNGMDFLEVSADQRSLCVHFFGRVPENITAKNVRIEGGRRIRGIKCLAVEIDRAHDEELDDCLHITLDKPGDFSTYRLCLVEEESAETEEDGYREGEEKGASTGSPRLQSLDPRYACLEFSFKVDCPSDLDCKADTACPPETFPAPEINYLAKDYASFRQLILDRLALTMPEWRERHIPDIGITLVELLAYVADYLSYYQDAVATEAYLDTARQRISVRRHARLVDYRMHEGNNARAWITVWTATDLPPLRAKDFYFVTGFADIKAESGNVVKHEELEQVPGNWYEVFEPLTAAPDEEFNFRAAHSEMYFYTWGNSECCLPKGATRATLLDQAPSTAEPQPAPEPEEPPPAEHCDSEPAKPPLGGYAPAHFDTGGGYYAAASSPAYQGPGVKKEAEAHQGQAADKPQAPYEEMSKPFPPRPNQPVPPTDQPTEQRILNLQPGDVLIFEEVLGPTTNNPADANPALRHAVRLTKVTPAVDDLLNKLVLEIEWAPEDALPFSLCLSFRLPAPDCRWISNVSVARGNVVLVDHGRRVEESLGPVETRTIIHECACESSVTESTVVPSRFNPVLKHGPLTFGEPIDGERSASRMLIQDPHSTLPRLEIREFTGDDDSASGDEWTPAYDLLASGANDRHFVVEMDDERRAHIRFGDGELGRKPAAGVRFSAMYRVGGGPAGNVGQDVINYLVLRNMTLSADAVRPRNPFAAQGGLLPEPVTEAKLLAPHAFRTRLERAITAEDYTTLAMNNAAIQKATAELRWTGSWYEARVAVDPLYKAGSDGESLHTDEAEQATSRLLGEISGYLHPYRRIGHDLKVMPAQYVPLHIAVEVCVLPNYTRGHVKAELLNVFSNRDYLGQGASTRGFFHPDNLSFGDGIYLSQLIALARSVEGVEAVRVTKLQRLNFASGDALGSGVLPLGAGEIAQLDNNPSFPERGRLELILGGGR